MAVHFFAAPRPPGGGTDVSEDPPGIRPRGGRHGVRDRRAPRQRRYSVPDARHRPPAAWRRGEEEGADGDEPRIPEPVRIERARDDPEEPAGPPLFAKGYR